ncbi:MAG TPA: SCO family protein [Candidatus Sulfotelmatobacter sp.]|nr:SCO family protein [Candidatus Sulfotelmatobacter sp.]
MTRKIHNSIPRFAHVGTAAHVGTGAPARPVERSSTAPARSRTLPFLMLLLLTCSQAWTQAMSKGIMSPPANVRPPYLQNVGIEQHLNGQVPPDLAFVDDAGRAVKLGDYFGKKPLILNLVYYNCTMLCGEALAGLTGAMKMVKFDVGNQFDVLTISFNPQETPAIAAAKKQDYLKRYGRPGAANGWHFLTGPAESINALTKAVGFQYQYDPRINQYAHATAIMVLTPQGRISRYFYGVDYPPKDLRMGLVEASQNKIGNAVDQVLLYCYHYDPETGKYGAVVTNILRLGAGLTILILGSLLLILFRLEKVAARRNWSHVEVRR